MRNAIACTIVLLLMAGCISERAIIMRPGQSGRLAQDESLWMWVKDSTGKTIKTKTQAYAGSYVTYDDTAPPVPGK